MLIRSLFQDPHLNMDQTFESIHYSLDFLTIPLEMQLQSFPKDDTTPPVKKMYFVFGTIYYKQPEDYIQE